MKPNNQYRARPSNGSSNIQRPAVSITSRQLPVPKPVQSSPAPSKPATPYQAKPATPARPNGAIPTPARPQNVPPNNSSPYQYQQARPQAFNQPANQAPSNNQSAYQSPSNNQSAYQASSNNNQSAYQAPANNQTSYQAPPVNQAQPTYQAQPSYQAKPTYQTLAASPPHPNSMVARAQAPSLMEDLDSGLAGLDIPPFVPAVQQPQPLISNNSTPMRSTSHQQVSTSPYPARQSPHVQPAVYSRSSPAPQSVNSTGSAPITPRQPNQHNPSNIQPQYNQYQQPNSHQQSPYNQQSTSSEQSPYAKQANTFAGNTPQPNMYNQQRPKPVPSSNPYATSAAVAPAPQSAMAIHHATSLHSGAPNTGSPNKRKASELESSTSLQQQQQPVNKRPQPDVQLIPPPPYSNSYVPSSSASSTFSNRPTSTTSTHSTASTASSTDPSISLELQVTIAKNKEIAALKKAFHLKQEKAMLERQASEKAKAAEILALKEKLANMERDLVTANQSSTKQEIAKYQYELEKQKQIADSLRVELEAQAFTKPKKEPVVEPVKREEPVAVVVKPTPIVSSSQRSACPPVPLQSPVSLPASAPATVTFPTIEEWTKTIDHSLLAFAAQPVRSSQLVLSEVLEVHSAGSNSSGLQEAMKVLSTLLQDESGHLSATLSNMSANLNRCCQLVMTDCLEPASLMQPCIALLAQAVRLMSDTDVSMASDVPAVSDEARAATRSRGQQLSGHVIQAIFALIVHSPDSWRSLMCTTEPADLSSRRLHPAFTGRSRILTRSLSIPVQSDQLDRVRLKQPNAADIGLLTSLVVQFVQLFVKHFTKESSVALAAALRFLAASSLESETARSLMLTSLPLDTVWLIASSSSFAEETRRLALDLISISIQYEDDEKKCMQFFSVVQERQQTRLDCLLTSLTKAEDRSLRLPIIRILSMILRFQPNVINRENKKMLSVLINAIESVITDETQHSMDELHPDAISNLTLDVRPLQKLVMVPRSTTSLLPRQIACLQACIELLALTLDTSITAGIEARLSSKILGALTDVQWLMNDRVDIAGRCSALLIDTRWHDNDGHDVMY